MSHSQLTRPPDDEMDDADRVYWRERDRFETLGPNAFPTLGGRKAISFEEDPDSPDAVSADGKTPLRGEAFANVGKGMRLDSDIPALERDERRREWLGHIGRVAEPLNPASPGAADRLWNEFRERYPELIGEDPADNAAFGQAIRTVGERMGKDAFKDRFTLYSETAREMQRLQQEADASTAAADNSPGGRLFAMFTERNPDLAGDRDAVEASARGLVERLEAAGQRLPEGERGHRAFVDAVAVDMRMKGLGKPVKASRRAPAQEEPEIRTETITGSGAIAGTGYRDALDRDRGPHAMIDDMKAIQNRLFGRDL